MIAGFINIKTKAGNFNLAHSKTPLRIHSNFLIASDSIPRLSIILTTIFLLSPGGNGKDLTPENLSSKSSLTSPFSARSHQDTNKALLPYLLHNHALKS